MKDTTIAVDLAKSVFEVAVSRRAGKVAERHRLSRGQFSRFLAERAPATLVMEACGTAHFWGREAGTRGHRVVLLPPHAVRAYGLRNKTDGADAKGLLEAVQRGDPAGSSQVGRPARARGAPSDAVHLDGHPNGTPQHGPGSAGRARARDPGGCAPGRAPRSECGP